MDSSEWAFAIVRSWIETTGQEVLTVNRSNSSVPQGDTVFYDVDLNGAIDTITLQVRLIGVSNGTDLAYSVSGDGFDEPWFDDANFHEVQTELAEKSVGNQQLVVH